MRSIRTCGVMTMAIGLLAMPAAGLGASPVPGSPDPAATVSAVPSAVKCPIPDGGSCLGPLAAGTYQTSAFHTLITYTVPDGWANYEDYPGNFLLVPPGSGLDGVRNGTSDTIGVALGVAVADGTCLDGPQAGVGTTAADMAAALSAREGLVVTEPVPVEVGGLSGVMIDIAFDPSSGGCVIPDPEADQSPIVPLITGIGPAEFHQVQGEPFTTRLYLLDHGRTNMVVQVSDASASPGTFADYEPIIDALVFGSR